MSLNIAGRILPKTKEEVKKKLFELGVSHSKINDDLSVDALNGVDISSKGLKYIPLNFNIVKGGFYCNKNELISLEGSPKEVFDFHANHNKLTSLKGGPIKVARYQCSYNLLTNLEYSPKEVKTFNCSHNQLKSLQGLEKVSSLYCSYNLLANLEYSPKEVETLYCSYNQLESLKGIGKVSNLYCSYNKLKSLIDCPKNLYSLSCSNNLLTNMDLNPQIKKLISLNISNNKITTLKNMTIQINKHICFDNNPISATELRYLYENKFPTQWECFEKNRQFFINNLRKNSIVIEDL